MSVHLAALLGRAHDGLFGLLAYQLGEQDQGSFAAMITQDMLADGKQSHQGRAGDTARKSRAAIGAGVHGSHPEKGRKETLSESYCLPVHGSVRSRTFPITL
jgi:hypothetical protein